MISRICLFNVLILLILYLGTISCNSAIQQKLDFPDVSQYPIIPTDTIQLSLTRTVSESSGMIYLDDQLWMLNDSGNSPELYQINPQSGQMERIARISDVANNDWEALTFDSKYVYIGDVGNNRGKRRNLVIYRINRQDLTQNKLSVIAAEAIRFAYADQAYYPPSPRHNFDCEAMLAYTDSIYLFTKNRADFSTYVYALPNQPGDWQAHKIASMPVAGQITGACRIDSINRVVLLGYIYYADKHTNLSFLWVLDSVENRQFAQATRHRWNLTINRQTEAITFHSPNTLWISSERSNYPAPGLYKVDLPDSLYTP